MLLGALASGFVEAFVRPETLARLLPRNPVPAVLAGAGLGIVLPVCECGIVVVVRRLLAKGLPLRVAVAGGRCGWPLRVAVAFLLAAPVVNPIVFASTLTAFGAGKMLLARFVLSFAIASCIAFLFGAARPSQVLGDAAGAGTGADNSIGEHAAAVRGAEPHRAPGSEAGAQGAGAGAGAETGGGTEMGVSTGLEAGAGMAVHPAAVGGAGAHQAASGGASAPGTGGAADAGMGDGTGIGVGTGLDAGGGTAARAAAALPAGSGRPANGEQSKDHGHGHHHGHDRSHHHGPVYGDTARPLARVGAALGAAADDLFDVGRFLIVGSLLAAALQAPRRTLPGPPRVYLVDRSGGRYGRCWRTSASWGSSRAGRRTARGWPGLRRSRTECGWCS